MTRGASAHFFLKGTDYERYYPLVLGVLQNNDLLVAAAERTDDRSFVRGVPRSGTGSGIEVEVRRRLKGVDVHVLVAPKDDLPRDAGRFLVREGAFAALRQDAASDAALADLLPDLLWVVVGRPTDPHFVRRAPLHIPDWIFFDLKGGSVMWLLGTLAGTAAAAYLLFWAPDGAYRSNDLLVTALLIVLAPWFAGIWSRTAARGTLAGFITVALPVSFYVVSALGWAFPGLQRPPGVSVIDLLVSKFPGPLALAVPAALGLLGAVTGAVAGAVGGKIFPILMKRPRASEPI